jgi:hypothetical protein
VRSQQGHQGNQSRRGRPVEPGGGRAFLLAAAGVAVSPMLLPWGAVGLALEIAAIVLGAQTLHRARLRGATAPFALPAVIGAVLAALFLTVALAFVAVFHAEYADYQSCSHRAITGSAVEECRTAFEHAVRARIGLLD